MYVSVVGSAHVRRWDVVRDGTGVSAAAVTAQFYVAFRRQHVEHFRVERRIDLQQSSAADCPRFQMS